MTPELYRDLLENLRQAVFLKDRSGVFTYVNERFCTAVGRSREDVLGRTDAEVFPAELAAKYRADDQRVISEDVLLDAVEENPAAGGELRYVQVVKTPLRRDGEIVGVHGVFWDVTDRVKAEGRSQESADALSLSEARFQSFMNNASAVAWVKDRTLRLRYVNHAFEEMFQRSAEQLIGCSDQDYLPAQVAEAVQENDRQVMAEGRPLERVEDVPGADGKMRHWLVTKFPFPGDGGETWIGGMAFEITARVEMEAALRESESRLKLMAAASQDPIWDHDIAAGRMWRNEAYEKLFDNDVSETAGKWDWWAERIHPEERERVESSLQKALADSECERWQETYHFRAAPGRYLYIQEHVSIERDAAGEASRLVGTMRDLTPLQQAQEEKERVDQKLREAQKLESLGVLAGGIAHDFNNLLTSMLGNVNLAQLELPATASVHPYLEDVEKAALRAADLCKQMLAYSGRGRFVVKRVAVNEVVEEMMKLLQVSISKQAVLKYNLGVDLPPVSADPTQLRQIVMNLVINASEAIGERSGLIGVTTGLMRADAGYLRETCLAQDSPPGDYVFIEVSDTGCGMDKATMDRIFDPFYTTKFTGRGLGLAAVLGIVRGHRGTMKVYSEPGKGTTFKLLLPCAEHGEQSETSERVPLSKASGDGLVLVVDDEETVRTTAARMLESAGYRVKLAADGREGLEVYEANMDEVCLVLLDLTMPHLDGVDTFRELRRLKPDVAVLLMSGYNEQDAVQRFTGKGLAGFVQKPFQIQTLLGRVKAAIEK